MAYSCAENVVVRAGTEVLDFLATLWEGQLSGKARREDSCSPGNAPFVPPDFICNHFAYQRGVIEGGVMDHDDRRARLVIAAGRNSVMDVVDTGDGPMDAKRAMMNRSRVCWICGSSAF